MTSTSASDTDWRPTTMPAQRRGGVLVKAQVAAAHSSGTETSVVLRGRLVNERLLCNDLGDPPPNAQSQNPVLSPTATPRERVEARMAMGSCAGCHRFMDYIGLGMEDMDALGRTRTTYTSGAAVDDVGQILALDQADRDFTGTAELAAKIGSTDQFASCLTKQWYRYAVGRRETPAEEECQIGPMFTRVKNKNYNLRDLLLSVIAATRSSIERPSGSGDAHEVSTLKKSRAEGRRGRGPGAAAPRLTSGKAHAGPDSPKRLVFDHRRP